MKEIIICEAIGIEMVYASNGIIKHLLSGSIIMDQPFRFCMITIFYPPNYFVVDGLFVFMY